MFTNTKCSIYAGQDKVYTESVCLSTDVKPTTGIANGSTCIEMNTGKKFMFNEDSGEWVEVPSSGGGGGGGGSSDFSTAQVTSAADSEETITIPGTISEIGPGMTSVTDMSLRAGNSAEVVIYQGHQFVHLELDVTVVSGSATVVTVPDPMFGDMKFLDITGDCTIKVTV